MKQKLGFVLVGVLLTALSLPSYAGGVSDGGGGISRPAEVSSGEIVAAVSAYAQKSLTLWLNQQETRFLKLSPEAKAASPFRKLFNDSADPWHALNSLKVDFRTQSPCLDARGHPREGSIHSAREGAICLSPFAMASKLDEFDYQVQSLALVAHEFSHLFGTSEEEAIEIQRSALRTLKKIDLDRVNLELDHLASNHPSAPFPNLFWYTRSLSRDGFTHTLSSLDQFVEAAGAVASGFIFSTSEETTFLPPSQMQRLELEFYRTGTLRHAACAQDLALDEFSRKLCRDLLMKQFAGQEEAFVAEVQTRQFDVTPPAPEYYWNLKIKNPLWENNFVSEMKALEAHAKELQPIAEGLRAMNLDAVEIE